jgi:hypothetical protein
VLYSAAMIAMQDGVSVKEVFERGHDELAIRVAITLMQQKG